MKTIWWKAAQIDTYNCVVGEDGGDLIAVIQILYDHRRDMWMWKTLVTPVWQDMPGVTNVEEAKAAAFVLWRMS